MCVVYESTCLKQGTTRPTPRKPGDAGPLEHGAGGNSEAETEQLTERRTEDIARQGGEEAADRKGWDGGVPEDTPCSHSPASTRPPPWGGGGGCRILGHPSNSP